ncbi:YceI family protein [Deinococcus arenicola]|uniref:YceI family protein n=1 Tax=Deinococcus arenicola TaxID=2994950 RepID=A0ABU4DNJ2_9DEIO|nr:YceI family protein [Deinococcus sp. ZS9-10]MDV6373997.1 YceI family protein [Deinococcus sp. ZS9-10]
MKFTGLLVVALLTLASAAGAPYAAGGGSATFQYRVTFVNVKGTMTGVSSSVELNADDLAATTGTVSVPLVDLKAGNSLRDSHAKGALDTGEFPNATFTLEKLTGGTLMEGQTLATTGSGTLTVKGVGKPITAPIKATLSGGKVNVSTQFKFNPLDYGVRYPGGADSITVNVAFVLAAR